MNYCQIKPTTNLLARDVVLEVEDCLLPVRVGRLGGGGEADALVAHAELDVEERHEGLQSKMYVRRSWKATNSLRVRTCT